MTQQPWRDVLLDGFSRVAEAVPLVVDGLSEQQLAWHPGEDANSIAWLIWHLARVEDDHMTGIAGGEQVWVAAGWMDRFALPGERMDIGYGQTPEQAHAVRASGDLLARYYAAVHERTVAILEALDASDLDRVVDRNWDPPVTAAVRMVSVLNDITQHIGQASYVRGLLGAPPVIG